MTFSRVPITATTIALSILATAYFWYGGSPDFLRIDASAFGSQPWRLLTSALVHLSFLHVAFNLYWMWILGQILEERLHPLVFLALILTVAASSGAAQFAVSIGGLGLSGVVYGLLGFLWFANSRVDAFRGLLPAAIFRWMIVWFFVCIVATRMNFLNVANVAHGVGALMGVVAAWVISSPRSTRPAKTLLYYGCVGLALLAGSWGRPAMMSTFMDEGDRHYVEILDQHGGDEEFLREHAAVEESFEAGDWERNLEQVSRLLAEHDRGEDSVPAIARLLYVRAFSRYKLGDLEGALADAERALRLQPDEPGAAPLAAALRGEVDTGS